MLLGGLAGASLGAAGYGAKQLVSNWGDQHILGLPISDSKPNGGNA